MPRRFGEARIAPHQALELGEAAQDHRSVLDEIAPLLSQVCDIRTRCLDEHANPGQRFADHRREFGERGRRPRRLRTPRSRSAPAAPALYHESWAVVIGISVVALVLVGVLVR